MRLSERAVLPGPGDPRPRVLFLCTRNSARSQMAEALLWHLAGDAVETASAGATPAMEVDPLTFEVLDELGIDWRSRRPQGFDAVMDRDWDVVVTVCDHARDACPVLPGHPRYLHWPLADPCAAGGTPAARRRAFHAAARELRERVSGLLGALPVVAQGTVRSPTDHPLA